MNQLLGNYLSKKKLEADKKKSFSIYINMVFFNWTDMLIFHLMKVTYIIYVLMVSNTVIISKSLTQYSN